MFALVKVENFVLEVFPVFGLYADKGHAEPQYVFKPHIVNTLYVRCHILNFGQKRLPVAAIGVTTVRFVSLPAVVNNHVFKSVLFCKTALSFDVRLIDVLMIAVPKGVQRFKCTVGRPHRLTAALSLPPDDRLADCAIHRYALRVCIEIYLRRFAL